VTLPDGTVGWQRWTDRAFFDTSGRLVEYQSVGHDITERKLSEQELRASRERLGRLTIELQRAEERERRRIATYLHDEVGQALAALRMKLAAIESQDHARSVEVRKEIDRILDTTIETVRSFTIELAPPVLYELGLPTAVEWIGRRIADEHGFDVAFDDDGMDKPLSEPAAALLFRGARELLMNAVKHSSCSRVRVAISRCDDERVEVVVEDDGRGIDDGAVEPGSDGDGFGLFSLRERLHALGGELLIESRPPGGTRAVMLVPLEGR